MSMFTIYAYTHTYTQRERASDEQIKMLKLVNLDGEDMGILSTISCSSSLNLKLFPNKKFSNVN